MLIKIKVKPNQSACEIKYLNPNLEVRLKSTAADGKANEELVKLLAKSFKVPQKGVKIKRGRFSKNKLLELEIDEQEFISIINDKCRQSIR